MNSNNQNIPEDFTPIENDSEQLEFQKSTSATTSDVPEFGWSGYAERINGRFAMLGFVAILLVEALCKDSFLHWSGIMPF